MSAKPKPTTVEWSDESCHLSEKQMKAMGFKSTWKMMEHYYDCKPGETKFEILHKSVRAMRCVLGRIDRMLRTPVKPNDANSGLFDRARDSHLYQIVLPFLYGKKCLKNALNNLEDSQLDTIVQIYTSLVNDAFNEAPMNSRIRNLKPVEEEGPEGVYHQLHEGRFSIDHLIEHLRRQKFPDVRNPRKPPVEDPIINGIINSMNILISNPENTIEDPRIYGEFLYSSFERVVGNRFNAFRPGESGEILRYKDELVEHKNEELASDLAAITAAEAAAGNNGAERNRSAHPADLGGKAHTPKPAKTVKAKPADKPAGGAGKGVDNNNIDAILRSLSMKDGTTENVGSKLESVVLAKPAIDPMIADLTAVTIIRTIMHAYNLKPVESFVVNLPKTKTGEPRVNYEIKIVLDPEPKLNIRLIKMLGKSDDKIISVFHGLLDSYYFTSAFRLKPGSYDIYVSDEMALRALKAVANPPSHGGGITRKRLRRSNATRKIRKF